MYTELLTLIGVPVVRAVAGFFEKALSENSDGGVKITSFEWQQLVTTILRLGVPALALFYGFNMNAELSATVPLVVDYLFHYVNKVIAKAKA
jgi:hypothetical protein